MIPVHEHDLAESPSSRDTTTVYSEGAKITPECIRYSLGDRGNPTDSWSLRLVARHRTYNLGQRFPYMNCCQYLYSRWKMELYLQKSKLQSWKWVDVGQLTLKISLTWLRFGLHILTRNLLEVKQMLNRDVFKYEEDSRQTSRWISHVTDA